MKASALIITYNQEKSIATAVESALMQKADFDFEVVVADDHSSDGTRDIVQEFERRHPKKVRAICRDQNLGGNINLIESVRACRGEYVALLEGDDRWTDPRKLQLQVDLLDAHADCSMCCHAVNFVYEDGSQPTHRFPPGEYKSLLNLEDILTLPACHTCSFMFRRALFLSPPDWLRTLWIGDWPLRVLMAEQGNVGYIDEVMADYRIHSGGVWSGASQQRQLEGSAEMFRCLRRHLGSRCSPHTAWHVAIWALNLSTLHDHAGNRAQARQSLLEAVGVLLEETPKDGNLIDELKKIVARIASLTPTADSMEMAQLRAQVRQRENQLAAVSRELARIKTSRLWRARRLLLSTPGLGRLFLALQRR
jgi:hypothetical protein